MVDLYHSTSSQRVKFDETVRESEKVFNLLSLKDSISVMDGIK